MSADRRRRMGRPARRAAASASRAGGNAPRSASARRLVAAAGAGRAPRRDLRPLLTQRSTSQTVGFNSLLYAMLALGLNIAVGWAGLLDLGYIAFFGFGAYGFAVLSSDALGPGGRAASHLPAIARSPDRDRHRRRRSACSSACSRCASPATTWRSSPCSSARRSWSSSTTSTGTLGGVNGLFGLDSLHGFGGQVTTPLGYYYLALIMLVSLMAVLHLLDPRAPGAPGARCATTRSPPRR